MKEFSSWPKHTEFKFPEPDEKTAGVWIKVGPEEAMNADGKSIHVNPREQVVPKNL